MFMPLTHIGRVCPVATEVNGIAVEPGGRVSLAWASANLDGTVFDEPLSLRLDRRPNPHVSFGFGAHLCLGAAHSRTLMKSLLGALCQRVERIDLVSKRDRVEKTAAYDRTLGYDELTIRMAPATRPA